LWTSARPSQNPNRLPPQNVAVVDEREREREREKERERGRGRERERKKKELK
jgi:hypothetical protein